MDINRLAEIIRRRASDPMAGSLAETAQLPQANSTGELRNAAPLAFNPILKRLIEAVSAPAKAYVDEFGRATDAVAGAMEDPSLPNVSEAAIRTLITAGRPIEAAGATAGAYGLAALGDAVGAKASAADPKSIEERLRVMPQDQLRALQKELGVSPDGRLGPATINAAVEKERAAEASRSDQKEIEMVRARAEAEAKARAGAETEQKGEVGRRVDEAKHALMQELAASREPARDETLVGRLYQQLGVLTPMAAGIGGGVAARIAKPALKTGNKLVDDYINPALAGSEAGGSVALAPTFATAYRSDPTNPEYAAWQRYMTRLPAEAEQEIAKVSDRLGSIDRIDPAVTQARDDLKNPVVRGLAMLQGGLGGLVGNVGAAAAGQVPGKMAQVPGRIARGYREGFSDPPGLPAPNPPAPLAGRTIAPDGTIGRSGPQPKSIASATTTGGGTRLALPGGPSEPLPGSGTLQSSARPSQGRDVETYRYYKDLPDETRQTPRDAYAAELNVNGDALPAKPTATRLQDMMLARGVNVPITPQRVKATNEAVTQFIKKFKRPPQTAEEWASVLNDKTLALPLAGGAAAGMYAGEGDN